VLCRTPQQAFEYLEVDITLPENTLWFDLYKHDIPVGEFAVV